MDSVTQEVSHERREGGSPAKEGDARTPFVLSPRCVKTQVVFLSCQESGLAGGKKWDMLYLQIMSSWGNAEGLANRKFLGSWDSHSQPWACSRGLEVGRKAFHLRRSIWWQEIESNRLPCSQVKVFLCQSKSMSVLTYRNFLWHWEGALSAKKKWCIERV